jgi:lysophospholipase L1-like esterase
MSNQNTRRDFIKSAAIGSVAAGISIPEIVAAATKPAAAKRITLAKDDIVLFQGDSITDWGRDHKKTIANDSGSLGNGYAFLTAAALLSKFYDKNLQIYNKGISGNKVYQLIDRWQDDTIAIKPNVLSVHIGVNDFWHTITSKYTGTIDTYIADYHKLIDQTKTALPDIKLVICEPFAMKGIRAVDDTWYPTFDLFRKAAKNIAAEYNAPFVAWQSVMDKASEKAPARYWSLDGVHPSIAGAQLMANAWMEAVQG